MTEENEQPTVEGAEEELEEKQIFNMNVMRVVKEAQAVHGLRYRDYQRYRQYCARRLRRIRKSLRVPYAPRGKYVCRVVEIESMADDRYLQHHVCANSARFLMLPLVNAERAWAYAMQLRQDNADEEDPRKRYHLLRRLRKAVKSSAEFLSLCQQRASDKTQLEAEAYHSWMEGNILLETEEWSEALDKFIRVRTVYSELQKVAGEADKELCQERLDEVEPSIRYCTYNLQRSKGQMGGDLEAASRQLLEMRQTSSGAALDMLKAKLETVLSETRKEQAETLQEITWLGQKIPVRSDSLREAILSAKEHSYELERAKSLEQQLELFSKIITCYSDAENAVRTDMEAKKSDQAQAAKHYIQSLSLQCTMQRNLVLCDDYADKFSKRGQVLEGRHAVAPSDLVALYEKLVNNVEDLAGLPGVSADDTMARQLSARGLLYKASRLYWVAESYATTKQHPQAVALLKRSEETAAAAYDRLSKLADCKSDAERTTKLLNTARGRRCAIIAEAALESDSASPSETGRQETSDAPLASRLDSFEAAVAAGPAPKLVDFPPSMEPVPMKPVLFDLAWNNIDFPNIDARVKQKRGGVLGWFRR